MDTSVILDFPRPVHPLTQVRSTLLLGAITAIVDAGYGDAYSGALAAPAREPIRTMVAGMWVPLTVAKEHYRACDALRLSTESAVKIGRSTLANTKGLLLGAATNLARGIGVTPWTLAPHFQRFWIRGYDGAGLRVKRLGPKELQLEIIECPLLQSPYYRTALRGVLAGLVELVTRKAYVNERAEAARETSVALRVQWA